MQSEEILDALEEYLGQYVGGTRGFAWQDPYRGDLFKLFLQAYKQGYVSSAGTGSLTGTAIQNALSTRFQPVDPSTGPAQLFGADCHPLGRLGICARSVPEGV